MSDVTRLQINTLRIIGIMGVLAWGLTIWWINGSPAENLPKMGWSSLIPHFDKVVHFGLYGILAGFAWLALGVGCQPGSRLWLVGGGIAIALATALGATDEWRQRLVSGRSASWEDWFADLSGAIVAVLVLSALHWWWMRRSERDNAAILAKDEEREVCPGV